MKRRPITLEDLGILFLMLAVILGGWLRLFAPGTAGFPLNDGGLFLVIMKAIQNNHFSLPHTIEFNGLTLPFAYPPFGFFVGAWISQTFHIELISILQWLPAAVLILGIPAFFWLAKAILGSNFQAGLATFIYALTPRASNWATMGGGLTRAFGLLFLLLTVSSVIRLFKSQDKKYLGAAVLFSALTVLSHPEEAMHAASFCLILFLFYGRSKTGFTHSLIVASGTILLTAIWWMPILLRFGLSPYLNAAQTGFHSLLALFFPFFFPLTDEPQITFIAVLGLIGFAYSISRRHFLLPILYLLPYITDLRNAPVNAMISLVMLATIAISELILPAFSNQMVGKSRLVPIALVYLGVYLFGSAAYYNIQFTGTAVSEQNRTAFEWIETNTPSENRVLVLTGETDTFCDGISEWFPALTGRISPTTVQGREWLPNFSAAMQKQRELQACLDTDNALECVENISRQYKIEFDYLYIARESTIKQSCKVIAPVIRGDALIADLKSRNDYQPVYQTQAVIVFAHKQEAP